MKWMKYWMRYAPWAAALAAMVLIAETDASATNQEPTSWWVDIHVDHAPDTMRSAYSPPASAPEALADADGDFRSVIRYLCLNAEEREMGNVAPAHLVFWEDPRPTASAVPGSIITGPLELRTTWGEETVVLQARAVPVRNRIYLDRDDAKDRDTGESSDAEFVRRLLESPSTASDSVVIELDWEEVGAVRYAYSLEGAASAIREAGRPCGVGQERADELPFRLSRLPKAARPPSRRTSWTLQRSPP